MKYDKGRSTTRFLRTLLLTLPVTLCAQGFAAETFPASTTINDVPWPITLATFGTRPDNSASADWIAKGSSFRFFDASGVVDREMRFTRGASAVDAAGWSNTQFAVADGNTHIAVTVSASGVVKVYKNGAEGTYREQVSGVGTIVSDAANDLVVSLDSVTHFAFWNVELSSAEISTLYNDGAGTSAYDVQPAAILVSTDELSSPGGANLPAISHHLRMMKR